MTVPSANPSTLERVSDAGSVSDADGPLSDVELMSLLECETRSACWSLHNIFRALRELRQLRALAEERRLGPREG